MIRNGVEFFDTPLGGDCQCARCGSSCSWEDCWQCHDGSLAVDGELEDCDACDGHGGYHACLSSEDWCKAHPIAGRENERGAR